MIGVRFVLEHHPEFAGLDKLTTHIIENYFVLNRLNCKGNNRLNHVMLFFVESSFDYYLVQEYGLDNKVNQRDNIGGTKFNPDNWTIKLKSPFNSLDSIEATFDNYI